MRIAVIGGGTAGLVTAYLLHEAHQVTVYERQGHLGGNVRTLNGNVPCTAIDPARRLENGVAGFHRSRYPLCFRLFEHLRLEPTSYTMGVGYFYLDGRFFLPPSPRLWLRHRRLWLRHGVAALGGGGLGSVVRLFLLHRRPGPRREAWAGRPIGPWLGAPDGRWGQALRCVTMLGLSTPWDRVAELSATMAMGNFEVAADPRWSFFSEGVYSYLALLCERMAGRTRFVLEARIQAVRRTRDGVHLDHPDGSREEFDAVVLATTPDQVLPLLADASAAEQQRFSPWESNHFPTVVHHDQTLYDPYGIPPYSGADFFERADGSFGYNTVMDGLGRTDPLYSFAYGLEDRIDPATVIDRSDHRTPRYSAAAVAQRDAIRSHNGSDRTFHAGAYLGNGLQEGAVASALEVSRRLGGRTL